MKFDDLKTAWQQRQSELSEERIEQLAAKVQERTNWFETTIRRRDFGETFAAVVVVIAFSFMFFVLPGDLARFGAAIVVLSSIAIYFVLYWGRGGRPAVDLPMNQYCRAQLERVDRQIFLLRNIAWWYVGPLMLGVCLVAIGLSRSWPMTACMCASFIVFGIFVYWLNQRAVRQELLPLREELTKVCDELESGSESEGESQ